MQKLQPETTYGAVMGSVLAIQRRNLGLEQTHVAQQLGVTQATWSRIEGGVSVPSVDQLARAAGILRIPPAEVLRRVDGAIANLQKQGIRVRHGSTKDLAQEGIAIIAAIALVALVMAALKSK